MRVALLCGDCPAGACGVGDYTVHLADSLRAIGVESEVIRSGDWSLHRTFHAYSDLRRLQADIVHVQYPTFGFGRRLGPQVQGLLRGCVITLHEVSQAHILRKLALLPFGIRAQHVIFPSSIERQFAVRWMPWIYRLSSVIPVPSNIKASAPVQPRRENEIVHFGLIMPKKGMEDVIKLAALIKATGLALTVRVIGTPPPKHVAYFEGLRSKASMLPMIWDHGLNAEQVADRLASSSVAYLPYPDGVSERRASIKAALINGVAVVTTRGPHTPVDLEGAVHFSQSPEVALNTARFLLENPEERGRLAAKATRYMEQFGWERIAGLHLALYDEIVQRDNSRLVPPRAPAKTHLSGSSNVE